MPRKDEVPLAGRLARSNRTVMALALLGIGIAGYLTLAHLNYLALVCGSMASSCDKVAQHPTSHGFGIPALRAIPTAVFGLLMFLGMAGVSCLRVLARSWAWQSRFATLQWALAIAGVVVVAFLSYLEAFVIHAWCLWCIATAVVVLGLFFVLTAERLAMSRASLWEITYHPPRGELLRFVALGAVAVVAYGLIVRMAPPPAPLPVAIPGLTRQMVLLPGTRISGDPDAPFMLVEIGEYECPDCRTSLPVVESLLMKYQDRMSFAFIPAYRPDRAHEGPLFARAAEAAGRLGRYWEMHAELYDRQREFEGLDRAALHARLMAVAGEMQLDTDVFLRALTDPEVARLVDERQRLVTSLKPYGYPNYYFFPPRGDPVRLNTTVQLVAWLDSPGNWRDR